MRESELEQEVGVGPGQPDGERAGVVVGGDAGQAARRRRLQAVGRALDAGVEAAGRGAADAEHAPEGGGGVGGAHRLAIGEAQPRPDREAIQQPALGRRRHRLGEVRHQLQPRRAGHAPEADQPVIDDGEELPVLAGVVDLRIDAACPGTGQQPERALRGGRAGEQEGHESDADAHPPALPPCPRNEKLRDLRHQNRHAKLAEIQPEGRP